jgi:uncharacterized protein YmfQ (DUF2313 family)
MSRFPLQLPPGTETFDHFARELVSLLGWTAGEGTLLAEDARVLGKALADAWEALNDAGKENFVTLAEQLLSEWESRVGVPLSPGSATADRQSALTAKRRSTGGNTRGRVLSAVKVFDASASIVTTTAQFASDNYDPRVVFNWAVAVSQSVYYQWGAQLREVLEALKPAHTKCNLGVLAGDGVFRCDDADSLTDETLLGG